MTAASFPRSQASPAPAEFAEIEPTRFCSVGGNGIKFYSNLRLTASVRCDQSAHCSARPWIATSNLELPRAAWKTPRCKSPCLAISLTLTAVCNARSLLADSTQGQKLITCMESSSIHRKSRKTVQICRHRESKITRWSAPTAGFTRQSRAYAQSNAMARKTFAATTSKKIRKWQEPPE